MGYLSTRLSRLEHAAGVRRDEIDGARRRAEDAAWSALVGPDPEASNLTRALAWRLLGHDEYVPPDLVGLSTAELKRRLDERVEYLRREGPPSGSGGALPNAATYIPGVK